MSVQALGHIFVCEFITGGGLSGVSLPLGLTVEGDMMLQALAQDLLDLGGLKLSTTRDKRLETLNLPLWVEPISPSEDIWERWHQNIRAVDAVWPIAPETGGILECLSRLVLETGRTLLGSRPEAIAVAASKLATARHLAEHGIAAVETVPITMQIPESEAGWVVKPDDGAGCEDTHYFMRIGELSSWLEQGVTLPSHTPSCLMGEREGAERFPNGNQGTYVLQPYIPGTPASLSLLCGDGRARVLGCNQQLIELKGSELHYTGVVVNALHAYCAELEPLAQRIAQALPGLWGYVGVDMVLTRYGPVVIEINPRLTTSYVGLRQSIGCNPAELVLGLLSQESEPWVIPLKSNPVTIVLPQPYAV